MEPVPPPIELEGNRGTLTAFWGGEVMESPVPRYYFNIINGSKIVDVEGREFPDSAAAVAEAQRFIDDWELPGTQMQVTDAKARGIARVQRRPTTNGSG